MIKLESRRLVRDYLCYKYAKGLYDPYKYILVNPFGDISKESIQYLRDKGVLSAENKLKMRVLFRAVEDKDKFDANEVIFNKLYMKAQRDLFTRFGPVSVEDVLTFMRTGKLVQHVPFVSIEEMRQLVDAWSHDEDALTEERVNQIWDEIKPSAIETRRSEPKSNDHIADISEMI